MGRRPIVACPGGGIRSLETGATDNLGCTVCVPDASLGAGIPYTVWGADSSCEVNYDKSYNGAMVLVPMTNASAVPGISVLGTAFLVFGIAAGGVISRFRLQRRS